MVFRSNKWNWKHLAARLLLVPVIGATAGLAQAQSFQSNWKNPNGATTTTTGNAAPAMQSPTAPGGTAVKAGSPKELVKAGRKALAEGKLDVAQQCATQAENAAAAAKYRWGMLEDTPASLLKDVKSASDKVNKTEAASLMKKAKTLYTQKTASDAERMANLDMAMDLASQAKSKHGSYSMLDMSEKPDALMADIRESQEALRKKTGLTPGSVAKTPASPSMPTAPVASPIIQTGATSPISTPSPAKADVLKIVADGRLLLSQDKVVEAKMKCDMARKLAEEKGVLNAFTASEDTPDMLMAACKAKATEMLKSLMADADKQMGLGAYDKADAACGMALAISNGMGYYSAPIEAKKAAIAAKMPGTAGVAKVGAPVAPAAPETLVQVPNRSPFLDQAAGEMKRGDLDVARTLAIRVYNDPKCTAQDKSEAQAILRQIDGELAGRKRSEAVMAYNNAMQAYNRGDFAQAHAVLMRIEVGVLAPEQKAAYDKAMEICTKQISPITPVAGQQDPVKADMAKLQNGVNNAQTPLPVPSVATPGVPTNLVSPVTPPANVTIVDPAKAAVDLAYDKLRTDGIEAMKVAGELWAKGDTDGAMKTLEDYTAKVNATTYTPDRKMRLTKPVQARIDGYGILKHNYDFELKEYKEKAEARNKQLGDRLAAAQKEDEIKKKAAEVKALQDAGKYKEGEALALQIRTLDPSNPFCETLYTHAKMLRRADDNKKLKEDTERLVYEGLQEGDRQGPVASMNQPVIIDPASELRNRGRIGTGGYIHSSKPEDAKVEGQLSASYPLLKFENMPMKDVVEQIKKSTGVNITIDTPTLEDEKISLDSVVITESFKDLSLHNALTVLLEKARLTYTVENGVVKITTHKRLKGKLKTKVYHVMDLVTPIPEYKLSPHQTLGGAIEAGRGIPPAHMGMGGITPAAPRVLPGGELASGGAGVNASSAGQLQSGNSVSGPNAMLPQRVQYAEQLKNMITKLVNHQSWSDNGQGGSGSIAYYDIGGAMVVNQTADIQREVSDLLDNLRRLQDLSVAVEIRVISLSETYFERIGVDFQANVTTNNASFERSLTTGSFRPEPFVNRIDTNGTTVGWSPATSFTSDLAVPIRPTSYNLTAPPFGGYQNSLSPTLNGGLSLGLAFLNDIQVYMFLEAAAGNRRINIMQAPKITLFNGQTSTVFVGDLAYFATGLQVYSANGQFVYLPVNQAFPIGQGFNPNGTGTGTSNGVSVTVQAIISADRRFVRLNLTPSLTALASATVPLYPITTFITPVFEGGSQGQPIPFTQFFQQPSFTEVSAQTTVAIPDGGTVLLGGLKTMAQGRNEFGPPVLSNIPYLNRLFKNVGIGQETRHVMLMVTPRIIINSEEEARQTNPTVEGNAGGN